MVDEDEDAEEEEGKEDLDCCRTWMGLIPFINLASLADTICRSFSLR